MDEFIKEYVKKCFIEMIVCKNFCDMYLKCKKSEKTCNCVLIINYFDKFIKPNNVDNIELYNCIFDVIKKEYMKLFKKMIHDELFYCLLCKYIKVYNKKKLLEFINKKIKCLKFDFDMCYKKYLPNTIALLELSSGFVSNDIIIKDCFNYYWSNYSGEFTKFPIIDTGGSEKKTLDLLEKYYNFGYIYFVGFNLSTTVSYVLEWFNMHPKAIGISATSTAPILNIPKSIFRMTANDNYILEAINEKLYSSQTVYYIYSDLQIATLNVLKILENDSNITNLKTFPVSDTNLTLDNLKIFLDGSTDLDSIVLYLLFDREKYINFYSEGLISLSQQYDITGITLPKINSDVSVELSNKYNIVTFKGTQTSLLWRNGYNKFGDEKYSIVCLNILNLLNSLVFNKNVNDIDTHFGILEFDSVTKDLIYPTFLIETFIKDKFYNKFLSVTNPLFGKFIATFTDNIPNNNVVKINNTIKYNKPIALFELTENILKNDLIYRDSLYYFWFKNPELDKFPIVDTKSNLEYTIKLLNKYYNEGYRIFLGFSRSTILYGVLEWFNNHPDAVGITMFSTAPKLKIKKNIYRMEYSDDVILESIDIYLKTAQTVYYIYTKDELSTLNVLEILENDPNINLKSYGVERDNSNLTVNDLTIFLDGSTENDITVLYIFDEQKYYNLYNENPPLTFSGNQYDILNGSSKPNIEGLAKDELNNKLHYVQNTSPNTSILWRENAEYLTLKYKKQTTSTGLCNALHMINYLKEGKNVNLLGSNSGVLQFDEITKDIQYPAYLISIYKKEIDNFTKEKLFFDDPLLGKFDASFV
jgi:hypothetical protein